MAPSLFLPLSYRLSPSFSLPITPPFFLSGLIPLSFAHWEYEDQFNSIGSGKGKMSTIHTCLKLSLKML